MSKEYTALGLMSGTSGDGVDASIIRSDGKSKCDVILNKYFEYDKKIRESIYKLKNRIKNLKDLHNLKYLYQEKWIHPKFRIFACQK